jgi:cytidylate kinase
MNKLQKCLLDYNNKWTNKIDKSLINDDTELRFTLLDMQKFAEIYQIDINKKNETEIVLDKFKEKLFKLQCYIWSR